MRALPALVTVAAIVAPLALVTVAAIVAPLASVGCYSVPDVQDGGTSSGGGDASRDATGPNLDSSSSSGGSNGSGSGGSSGGAGDGSVSDASCNGAVLCPCGNAMGCKSGVCAQSMDVGATLFGKAGGNPFCSQACCTSRDCPSGTVCFASGEGGQYCVDPAWIGRATPASNAMNTLGGSPCSTNADCRSGLCASGACADTCCSLASSGSECASQDSCVFGTFPGQQGIDTHFAPHCGATGPQPYGSLCTSNSDCQGGLCFQSGSSSNCTNPCRSQSECGSGNACQFYEQGGDLYSACFPLQMGQGTGDLGATCSMDLQCLGLYCNTGAQGGQCTGPCFTNADCAAVPGWRCTPQLSIGMLPTGNYNALGCGP
jgi:hypothetical protein